MKVFIITAALPFLPIENCGFSII
jgi:secreted trypsin-like serine protease